jgi:MFS family permease
VSGGFLLTSFATRYWHVVLAQGLCAGLGAGCLAIPSVALLPQYFARRRAIATGIATAGSSLGGVVYPLLFQGLLERVGFAWACRVMGFVALATCSFSVSVMRLRATPRRVRSLLELAAFREVPYVYFCATMFFSNMGFFVPIFYLQTYALVHGVQASLALHLVAIVNAASVVGRIVPAYIASKAGPVNIMFLMAVMATVVVFSWIGIVDQGPGHIVFGTLYGFASGGIIALPAVVLASITKDLSYLGTRLGMCNFISSIAALVGAPIAGAILKSTGKYIGVQIFGGLTILFAVLFLLGIRITRAGTKLWIFV